VHAVPPIGGRDKQICRAAFGLLIAVEEQLTHMVASKKAGERAAFKPNDFIVYPAHGVGKVAAIEKQEVAGYQLELIVVNFEKDKMTLRVPISKAKSAGMRKLADGDTVAKALKVVTGRPRVKRTMWSRRAQEYEAKINSGDLIAIAEVVRDLFRADSQPEQSYSERQLYEAAVDRMSREIAAVKSVAESEALRLIEEQLAKSPRGAPKSDDDAAEEEVEPQEKAA
jgi:CarD family transcriptional regulator